MAHREAAAGSAAAFINVLRHADLRRLSLAVLASGLGDGTYAIALTVLTYHQGGAAAVGALSAARFVLMSVAGPLGAALADCLDRRRFLIGIEVARAALIAVAALLVVGGASTLSVCGVSLVLAAVASPARAARAGLVPWLCSTPRALTSNNAVTAGVDSAVLVVGPALGAIVVVTLGPAGGLWLAVPAYLLAAWFTARTRPRRGQPHGLPVSRRLRVVATSAGSGFASLTGNPAMRATASLAGAHGMLLGAVGVLNVILIVQLFHDPASHSGYLVSLMGFGGILGSVLVLRRTGRARVGTDLAVGVLGWSLPLVVLGLATTEPVAIAAMLFAGAMEAFVVVGMTTLPQRLARRDRLASAYAAIYAIDKAALALGSALVPLVVAHLGLRATLVLTGVVGAGLALAALPRMRAVDTTLRPPDWLDLVASVPLFRPLDLRALEGIAARLHERTIPAGSPLIVEGEVAQELFVIIRGDLSVTSVGQFRRWVTSGEVVGEIGLLRDVPRTASVNAATEVQLLALTRADFLELVTGHAEAHEVAETLVRTRLGT